MTRLKNHLSSSVSVDLRSLAVARILFALLLICDLIIRSGSIPDHYTASGLLPLEALFEHYWKIGYVSVHTLSDHYLYQVFLFVLSGFSALMLLAGWKTRFFTILSWFLLASLNTRNPFILQAGDVLFRCLLFWAIFMPWGERFSIDSLRTDTKEERTTVISPGAAAFMLQVFFMYFFAGIIKDHPVWNESYEAVYFALSMEQFSWFLGPVLYRHPEIMEVLTFSVFWIELLAPFIFFVPFRNGLFRLIGIIIFGSLQLGLMLTMWLGLFPLISMASLAVFLPAGFWKRLPGLEIFIDRIFMQVYRLAKPVMGLLPGIPWGIIFSNTYRKYSRVTTVLLIFLLVYVFYWNMTTLNKLELEIPNGMNWIARVFRIDQKWNMFAPHPATNDGWFIIKGQLQNGEYVDLLNNDRHLRSARPGDSKDQFRNYRWRKYMRNMLSDKNSEYRPYFGRYLCTRWNKAHSENERLIFVEVYYMVEKTLPDYKTMDISQESVLEHECDDTGRFSSDE